MESVDLGGVGVMAPDGSMSGSWIVGENIS